jgi:hypothetical protein
LNVVDGANASAYQGAVADLDLADTIRLIGVTLTDGTLVNPDVRFKSGFSRASVPESSSWLMLATGAIASICVSPRLRKRLEVASPFGRRGA